MERSLTGEHFQYLVVCDTKLWYHHYRPIDTTGNKHVQLGNIIENDAYDRDEEVRIGSSVVDFTRSETDCKVYGEKDNSDRLL